MSEAKQPSNELAMLQTENDKLKEENRNLQEQNGELKAQNQRLRTSLLAVLSQIHIGQPVASDGTPLLKIKTINDAEALLAELGLRVRS